MSDEEKKDLEVTPKVKGVAQGAQKRQGGRIFRKLKASLTTVTREEAEDYLIDDVLVPVILNGIADFLGDAVDYIFRRGKIGGRANRSSKGGNSYGSPTDYGKFSQGVKPPERNTTKTRGTDQVVFESAAEAKDVLDELIDAIDKSGEASVYDFFQAARLKPPNGFTDQYFGWTDLSKARIENHRGDWYIVMPNVIELPRR